MPPEAALVDDRLPSAGVRYYAEHEIVADEGHPVVDKLPSPEELETYPGLRFLRLLETEDGNLNLGSYWLSKQDFEASRGPLERRTGAKALRRAGFLRQLWLPKTPLSRRLPAFVLSLVALLGALEALQNHYSRLFERPEVFPDLGGAGAHNVSEDTPFALDLVLLNGSQHEVAKVKLEKAELIAEGQTRGVQPLTYPRAESIPAGGTVKIPIRGGLLHPGSYQLTIAASARVGMLRGWCPLSEVPRSGVARNVVVWSTLPRVVPKPLLLERRGRGNASLSGAVLVDDEASLGLDCEVVLTQVSDTDLHLGPVQGAMATCFPSPNKERWIFGPVPPYSRRPFRITLAGNDRTAWDTLAARAEVTCREHRKEDEPCN